jgi:hypothetical protein
MDVATGVQEVTAPAAPRRARIARNALIVLGIYIVCSFVCSGAGFLGGDSGGKVATLREMDRHSTLVPQVGYWAAAQDPGAALHPLYYTTVVNGHYVNVTTLPLLIAEYPLYKVGGYRLALLVPMLGALACALIARALARRWGAGNPDLVFWIVALASPVAIYALDIWEHTWGLALMLLGVLALTDALAGKRAVLAGGLAGLCFGAAAALRTEALVYGAVATLAVCVVLVARSRRVATAAGVGVAALVGVAVPWFANSLLERALLGATLRSGRASSAASAAGDAVGVRLREAITTTIGLDFASRTAEILVGGGAVVLLAFAVLAAVRGRPPRQVNELFGAAAVLLLFRFTGLGFIPGVFTAFPFAAAALFVVWRYPRLRLPAAIALLAMPLVWYTAYTGNAGAQWGGRYLLCSSLLLAVGGIIVVAEHARGLLTPFIVLCVAVTGFGFVNLVSRSYDWQTVGRRVLALSSDVVISRDGFLFREAGGYYTSDRHWLTAPSNDDLDRAVGVADATGAHTMSIVTSDATRANTRVSGWHQESSATWSLSLGQIYVTNYVRTP